MSGLLRKQFSGRREALQIWSQSCFRFSDGYGICGTTMGMQGMVANMDLDTTTTENLYSTVRIALLTFIWAGLLAGWDLRLETNRASDFKLSIAGLTFVLFCLFYLIFDHRSIKQPKNIFHRTFYVDYLWGNSFEVCFLTALACGKASHC